MTPLQYALFYRKFGILKSDYMVSPKLHPIGELLLPRGVVFHYVGDNLMDFGIAADDPVVVHVSKILMIDHITKLTSFKGLPRSTQQPAVSMIRRYHLSNRRTRNLGTKLQSIIRDDLTMVVENYALLNHLYRYVRSFYSNYYRWYNVQATLWDTVDRMVKETGRHQYIRFTLPNQLPTLAILRQGESVVNRQILEAMPEQESLAMLDFWTWLGNHREKSIMSRLSHDSLDKIDIIWFESGRWITLNLGLLNKWRISHTEEESEETKKGVAPAIAQRRYFRMIMRLFEARTVAASKKDIELFAQAHPDATPAGVTTVDDTKKAEDNKKILDALNNHTENDTDPEAETHEIEAVDETDDDELSLPAKMDEGATVPPSEPEPEDDIHAGPEIMEEHENREEIDRVTDMTPEEDLHELQKMSEYVSKKTETRKYTAYTPPIVHPEDGITVVADNMADAGLLSAIEYKRIVAMSTNYQKIPSPYNPKETLHTAMHITKQDTAIPQAERSIVGPIQGIVDKSMEHSSLEHFDPKYVKSVMHKDVINAVVAVQAAGIAVQNYTVDTIEDLNNSFERHTIKLVPVIGAPSTVKFDIPKVKEDGSFMVSGVHYRMRKQRSDLPIRKVAPNRVALTSYYSKLFVYRSDRKTFNYPEWIKDQVTAISLDKEDGRVTELKLSNVFDHTAKTPRIYSILASRTSGFVADECHFHFNYNDREKLYGVEAVKKVEGENLVVCGNKGKQLIVVDYANMFYVANATGEHLQELGHIEDILKIPVEKMPYEIVETDILGKPMPIGFVLAYEVGFGRLLNLLKIEPRRVVTGERLNLEEHEFAVRFADETLVFSRDNKIAEFMFGGFNRFHRDIKRYGVYEFDKKDVYQIILDRNKLGARYIREMDLLFKMFVDHITKELLVEMHEPVDLVGLLIRSTQLLLTDRHPAPMDMAYMRDKGYERIAGAVYGELARAVRSYKSRPATSVAKVDMNPFAVWQTLLQDPAVTPVKDSNPIHNLREKEVVIFGGVGGRSARTMTESNRTFHRSQMGVTSESTVDSGDVATTLYLTADPNYVNVRGVARPRTDQDGPATLVSTSMLLAPGADRDDPKRVNFISIQNSASISSIGYQPMPLRTGYDRIMAHRCDELYATTAKEPGKVVAKTDNYITIESSDGKTRSIVLGRRFGVDSGSTVPHMLVSELKVGDTVKVGTVIAYNSHFFTRDTLDPSQVIMKFGILARTVLMECSDTFEDSSAISEDFAKKLVSKMTHIRSIKVRFDQEVRNLVREGQEVDIESILCTIEDHASGNSDLFDEASLDTLRLLSNKTPRAKYSGKVERIEVLYNGDIEDMNPTLENLASASDRQRSQLSVRMGGNKLTGRVDTYFRVDNRPLEPDSLAIQVYITGDYPAGVGDKGVFANQMKTTFGRVMTGINQTKSGKPIDAVFGYESINKRIVNSAILIGTTNTLLRLAGEKALKAYRSK